MGGVLFEARRDLGLLLLMSGGHVGLDFGFEIVVC
jgi:hypothetical protein